MFIRLVLEGILWLILSMLLFMYTLSFMYCCFCCSFSLDICDFMCSLPYLLIFTCDRFGVLGHGKKEGELLPRRVGSLENIRAIATGQSHVLAIDCMFINIIHIQIHLHIIPCTIHTVDLIFFVFLTILYYICRLAFSAQHMHIIVSQFYFALSLNLICICIIFLFWCALIFILLFLF